MIFQMMNGSKNELGRANYPITLSKLSHPQETKDYHTCHCWQTEFSFFFYRRGKLMGFYLFTMQFSQFSGVCLFFSMFLFILQLKGKFSIRCCTNVLIEWILV